MAFNAGPTAAMAEAPHIDVPTPIKAERFLLNPSFLPNQKLKKSEKNITTRALITPTPTANHIEALVTSPREAMVPLSSLLELNCIPNENFFWY